MTTLPSGWRHLPKHDQVWDRFEERFQFRASVDSADWPAIVEPVPSLTWDLGIGNDSGERGRSVQPRVVVDNDRLNRLVLSAFQARLPADEWVYVLDWQHPAYRCWPHQVDTKLRTDLWPVEVFPNGDYYIFAAQDLSFGTFGHPWEGTICVWGAELLNAVEARNVGVLNYLRRRDGKTVSDSQHS